MRTIMKTKTTSDDATASEEGLRLQDVSLFREEQCFVRALDLRVRRGEIVVCMGASGSGKSSLLSYLCGALSPAFRASGRVFLDGEEITETPIHLRRVGLLFQEDLLFPHMSVGENLAFAARAVEVSRGQIRDRVEEALEQAGLSGFATRDPHSLSGGQKARVSLMRCLLARPRALLLDEPFSKLDLPLRRSFRRFVFAKIAELCVPTLLVTHDPADARAAGGRLLAMESLARVRRKSLLGVVEKSN